MTESLPMPIRRFKGLTESVAHFASSWAENAAEHIVRDVFGLIPASEVASESSDDDHKPSQFADAEEISWLESDRKELPYRRDTHWAIAPMWWEMAFGGIGAATYSVSSIAKNPVGMAVGWVIGAGGKGLLLLGDLGRPERFPRVFSKPQTSWISRGSWAFAVFGACGAVSLIPALPKGVRAAAALAANAGAGVLTVYDGLFLNDAVSVASWRSRKLPALFGTNAVQAGAALTAGLAGARPTWISAVIVGGGAAASALSTDYVSELAQGNTAARLSARDLVEDKQKLRFLVMGIGVGTLVPMAMTITGRNSRMANALTAAAACAGVVSIRRSVLQAGIHAPVIDPPRTQPIGTGLKDSKYTSASTEETLAKDRD
ncbi:hypothetical protein U6G28_11490 [Actinomycetaceae bacterium MB13-C1-2]|nr:hypothetical protein U6G28_11490 [Actinomycetaceae bacterium MB13-C1-2]